MKRKRLIWINIILLLCAGASLLCYGLFGSLWIKGLTSGWFVVLGGVNLWAFRKLKGQRLRFFLLMAAGLLCGMCADVLLGVEFLAGVAVFALGHGLYLAAFCAIGKFRPRDMVFIAPMAALSLFFLVASPWITVDDPAVKGALSGYALVISAMVGKAVSNLVCRPCLYRWLLAVGSVMFWFSDLMLAMGMFGESASWAWILCGCAYWPGQNVLAHAMMHAGFANTELAESKHEPTKK